MHAEGHKITAKQSIGRRERERLKKESYKVKETENLETEKLKEKPQRKREAQENMIVYFQAPEPGASPMYPISGTSSRRPGRDEGKGREVESAFESRRIMEAAERRKILNSHPLASQPA